MTMHKQWATTIIDSTDDAMETWGMHFLIGDAQVWCEGPKALLQDLQELVHRGQEDRNDKLRKLEHGGVGYYVVYFKPPGVFEAVHITGPLIENMAHVIALGHDIARRQRVGGVIVVSWTQIDAAPLVVAPEIM